MAEEWEQWSLVEAFTHFYKLAQRHLIKEAEQFFDEEYPSGYSKDGLTKEEWIKKVIPKEML